MKLRTLQTILVLRDWLAPASTKGYFTVQLSQRTRKREKTYYIWLAITALLLLIAWLVQDETRSSSRQAQHFSSLAGEMTYTLAEGDSPVRLSVPSGPYEIRLGYASLRTFSQRLLENDFLVARQARPSWRMKQVNE